MVPLFPIVRQQLVGGVNTDWVEGDTSRERMCVGGGGGVQGVTQSSSSTTKVALRLLFSAAVLSFSSLIDYK